MPPRGSGWTRSSIRRKHATRCCWRWMWRCAMATGRRFARESCKFSREPQASMNAKGRARLRLAAKRPLILRPVPFHAQRYVAAAGCFEDDLAFEEPIGLILRRLLAAGGQTHDEFPAARLQLLRLLEHQEIRLDTTDFYRL